MNDVTFTDARPVDGYGPGFFRIGGTVFQGHVISSASGTQGWGGMEDRAPLLALAPDIDVLLLGAGAEIAQIPGDLRNAMEAADVGVEVMSSPAACRTYNVLLAEGRRVALAVLAVGTAG